MKSNLSMEKVETKSQGSARTVALWVLGLLLMFTPYVLHATLGLAISPVLTGSMRPTANPGDLILTKQVQASNLKAGEVAVLRNPNDYALYSHRIQSITAQGGNEVIQTKGDNNPAPDSFKVTLSKLETVPVRFATIRWVGWVIVGFTSHVGQILAFLTAGTAILFGGGYLFSRERELRELKSTTTQNPRKGKKGKKGKKDSKGKKNVDGKKSSKGKKRGQSTKDSLKKRPSPHTGRV